MTTLFDPRDPALRADPYPVYRRLRDTDPVHRTASGYWVLTRYDDIEAILKDSSTSSGFPWDETWAKHRGGGESPIVRSTRNWMMMLDGAAHRRIRRLVGHVFTIRAIERLRPRIRAAVDEQFDRIGEGEVDLVSEIALPLPIVVIGELLGIPREDRARCREWTDKIGHVVDPFITPEMRDDMNSAETEFRGYLAGQLDQRKREPGDDLLTSLLTATLDGERLSDDEIIANVLLLFNAGHETTVNTVGNSVLALLRHPEQLDLVREHPEAIPEGVDELTRYDAPVQAAARLLTGDVELAGKTIPRGSKVMVLYGAANRDPARYRDPDRLDLRRGGIKALAFGSGPHFCIGAPLGRLEAEVVLTALFERYRTVEPTTDEVTWRPNFTLRGLAALPVKLLH
ncbi:cytochrome P450 [Amycolatopsis minnesotensis]|uniref:Cytochrome P450 n=1 Tax=Amycolatopsis minnesotensis TaxID=337894 RepID=A0ABN2R6F8_9PSEU